MWTFWNMNTMSESSLIRSVLFVCGLSNCLFFSYDYASNLWTDYFASASLDFLRRANRPYKRKYSKIYMIFGWTCIEHWTNINILWNLFASRFIKFKPTFRYKMSFNQSFPRSSFLFGSKIKQKQKKSDKSPFKTCWFCCCFYYLVEEVIKNNALNISLYSPFPWFFGFHIDHWQWNAAVCFQNIIIYSKQKIFFYYYYFPTSTAKKHHFVERSPCPHRISICK